MNYYNFMIFNGENLLSQAGGYGNSAMESFENAVRNGWYVPIGIELQVIAHSSNNLKIAFTVFKEA